MKKLICAAAALLLAGAGAVCWLSMTPRAVDMPLPTPASLPASEAETGAEPAPGPEPVPEPDPEFPHASLLRCNFYDERGFRDAVLQAESYGVDGQLLCGTAPHHLLASRMIASFFQTAAQARPGVKTVVLIAPMHEGRRGQLRVTRSDWNAPTGILPTNTQIVDALISQLDAVADDTLLQEDHSASGLIPFVKYYFPESSVACLLISGLSPPDTPERVAQLLAPLAKDCLFVFSVDFSHYLAPEETEACDQQTREAVLAGDVAAIARMGNDNMDSPMCVNTLIRLTGLLGGQVREWDHANAMDILRLPFSNPAFEDGLTSYFIFAGVRGEGAET